VTPADGPIVCVGAHMQSLFMHVERVPREGETVLGWGYREPVDGGKVANAAVAAARLGAPVGLVTALGTDVRSHRWRDYFRTAGIGTDGLIEFAGPMDVGPALLPPSKIPVLVSVTDLGRRLTASTVASRREVIGRASIVVCALESPQDGAAAAFRVGRSAGAITILNASPAAELDPALLAVTDIVVVNEHEAAAFAPDAGAPSAAAARLRGILRVDRVVVTAGAGGAFVAAGDGDATHVAAPPVDVVVDTTGAGDAFVGALAVRMRVGDDVVAASAFAVRAASLACTRESTMSSYPTLEELLA
jgi:ribokinase